MSAQMTSMAEDEGGSSFLAHLPAILRQRRWLIFVPTIATTIAGIAAAFLLPVKYESKSTLLVEAPLLPEEVADSGEGGIVDQRMARIRQQVLSRPQLIELIRQNGLYSSELQRLTLSDVIEKMRDSIAIEPVTADIARGGGGNKTGTIAFSMAYTYSDPYKAQTVAQALTEQVLTLDATKNAENAANLVQFLRDQETGLVQQINALESQISDIKARNGIVLSAANTALIGGGTGGFDAQIAALQRDNANLMNQRAMAKTSDTRDPVVANAEAQLAAARASYTETHPDVILAKQRLAEAKKLASTTAEKLPLEAIDSQIAFNNSQISALQSARAQESARQSQAINAQARAPVVLDQIGQLQKRLDVLNAQYQGVSSRLLTASAGKKAEDEQQGERLTIIDPPVVPDEPVSPNRPLLILGGIVAGAGLGVFLALALEFLLRPIRDAGTIQSLLGEAPLVTIPTLRTGPPATKWYRRLWPLRRKAQQA